MEKSIFKKPIIKKIVHGFFALTLIFNMTFLGLLVDVTGAGAAPSVQYKLEGQRKSDSSFTTGNICSGGGVCYSEGEQVMFKLEIKGLNVGDLYTVKIGHDYEDASNTIGYESFSGPDSWDGTAEDFSLILDSTSPSLPSEKIYSFSFKALNKNVQLKWAGTLGLNSSVWNGASLHVFFDEGGDGEGGRKKVPINPKNIISIAYASITLNKTTDPVNDLQSFTFTSNNLTPDSINLSDGGSATWSDLVASSYTITESAVSGWSVEDIFCNSPTLYSTSSNSITINLQEGENANCTFANKKDVVAPTKGTLVVEKKVNNIFGGTLSSNDFKFTINNEDEEYGFINGEKTLELDPGSYTVTEVATSGYSAVYDNAVYDNCENIVLVAGETETCIITNSDIQPKLTIIKQVSGGILTSSDFEIDISGTNVSSPTILGSSLGVDVTLNAGFYNVIEKDYDGYTSSYGDDCSGEIAIGEEKTCIIVNTYVPPVVTPEIDLELTKQAESSTVNAGATTSFELILTNKDSLDKATNISVLDILPAGLTFVSATPQTGEFSTSTWRWTIDELASGASTQLIIIVKVNEGTEGKTITNTATATAYQIDIDLSNNTASASVKVNSSSSGGCDPCGGCTPCDPTLSLTKTVADETMDVGATTTYTLVLSNSGPGDASDIVVIDNLPEGITYISSEAGTYDNNGREWEWKIESLNKNTSTTTKIIIMVNADTEGNVITNTATVVSEDISDSATFKVNDPTLSGYTLSLDKTIAHETIDVGATTTYTLILTNNGPDNASDIVVTDDLPGGVTYISSEAGTYNATTGIWKWEIESLNKKTSTTTKIVVKINDVAGGTKIVNKAEVGDVSDSATTTVNIINGSTTPTTPPATPSSGGGGGGGGGFIVPVQDIASEVVVLGELGEPYLTITKTVSTEFANPGDVVEFTVMVTNNGNLTAFDVVLTDTLPDGFAYVNEPSWFLEDIESGKSKILKYSVLIGENAEAKNYVNSVQANSANHEPIIAQADLDVLEVMVLGVESPQLPASGFRFYEMFLLLALATFSLSMSSVMRKEKVKV